MTTTVIFTTLQENRNKKRIWLQGVSLAEAGFNSGDHYERSENPGEIVLQVSDDGKKKVSRKKVGGLSVPVIDISNDKIAEIFPFDTGTQLRVICRDGRIVIRLHPDVAAKKEREARILDRFKTRKAQAFAYFVEDSPLTTALNEGLLKFGHESFVQLGVSLTDQLKPSHIQLPAACRMTEQSVICGNFDQLMVAIDGSPKPAPVEFLYAGDPSIHSDDASDQNSPFFFKLRAIEALNPGVVMFDVEEDLKAKNLPPLLTVAIQIMTQLGYVIQSEVIETDKGTRRCILAVSEGLSKHDWTKLLACPPASQNQTVAVSSFTHSYIEDHKEARQINLCETLFKRQPLKSFSGFSGGGILSNAIHQGLASGGIDSEISVGIELEDQYLSSSLTNNRDIWAEDPIVVQGSIACSRPRSSELSLQISDLGVPCTGASRSGISKNKLSCAEEHSNAGSMFYWALRHLLDFSVPVVVVENVKEYLKTISMKVIKDTLRVFGYSFQERVLSGMEFGSFEDRHRLCFLAVSESLSDYFDLDQLVPVRQRESTLGEILEDVPQDSPMWKTYDYLAAKEARDIAAGKGFRRQLLDASATKAGTIGRGYAKARSTEGFVLAEHDSSLSRLFTVTEHARLKTIPASLVDGLSNTTAHQILGQSVIHSKFVSVGQMLANGLRKLQAEVLRCDDFTSYMEDESFVAEYQAA